MPYHIFGYIFAGLGALSGVIHLAMLAGWEPRVSFFGKLDAFKNQYGVVPGTLMHAVGYVVVPIVVGISMLLRAE